WKFSKASTGGHMITQNGTSNDWFETIQQYHPQMTDKILIDLVNGIEVVEDHLRCRNTSSPFLERIWNVITGKTLHEQYIIDINLKVGLEAVTAWLKDIQAFQAKSDLALSILADKFSEIKLHFKESLVTINCQFEEMIEIFQSKIKKIDSRIYELEMKEK